MVDDAESASAPSRPTYTVTEFAAGSERYLYARADDLVWVRRAQRARHDHIRQGRTSFSCTVVHARPSFATRRRLYSYV